jgi:hypothetical protein
LQHMILSEFARIVPRNQATNELFPVIGQISPPHTTQLTFRAEELRR